MNCIDVKTKYHDTLSNELRLNSLIVFKHTIEKILTILEINLYLQLNIVQKI